MKALKPALLAIAGIGLLLLLLSFAVESLESIRWTALVVGLAAFSMHTENRIARAAVGTAVLAALVFFFTEIVSDTAIGRKNIDLTEDDRFTLTEGTKSILAELEDPVTINYYVTRDIEGASADIKRYIPRVDNFLEEISGLAKNENITLNFIDPQANTDEEDAAIVDEINITQVSETGRLFFGASISSLDKKKVIPFFNPEAETQLEYDIISAIAEVTVRNRPVIGLVTPLNISTGGQSRKGQAIYSELKNSRELADLGMSIVENLPTIYENNEWGDAPDYLDPERIPVVLVVHPAGITPEAEFALDQYLLRGGNVIACVDSLSLAAQQTAQQPQFPGMPPQGGTPTVSTLPQLFEKHGIVTSGPEVLFDPKFAADNPFFSVYNKEDMSIQDDITLASIQNLVFLAPGAFTSIEAKGLEVSRILKSSDRSGFVPDTRVKASFQNPQTLTKGLSSKDKGYDLVVRLSGEFETAFPDGNPADKKEDEEEKDSDDKKEEKADGEKTKEAKTEALKKGTATGNLILVADSDFIMDRVAYGYRQALTTQGVQLRAVPLSGNGPFLLNIVDQANNSAHLIGARARTPVMRPLTVFKDLEAEYEQTIGKKVKAIQEELDEANKKLSELVQKRAAEGRARFTAEETKFYFDAQKERAAKEREMREEQKGLQSDIDAIKSGIFLKSLLIVPGLVILAGIGVFIYRRMSTQAR
ncbi:MAG: Gldg family protein [Akkermansiaceae bacterium]|nr:Gldg family protein [Akkermansiaceae bacterium]